MKKIFLQLVFIFFLSFFTSCEREEFEISNESTQNQSDYQIKKISFSELKRNRNAFEKLKESRSKMNTSLMQRGVFNEDFGVFIDTTNILITEKDGKHSITFRIINDEELSKVENLVLNSKNDGSYKAFIAEYLLSQEELIKLENNEDIGDKKPSAITDMSTYARFSITGNGADCLTVISFFVESCRNSQGDIIPTDSDLGDGCVGMSFPVEHRIMVIDAGCLSGGGGGGGNDSGGDNSGYNPGGGGGNWSGGGGSPTGGDPDNPNTGNPNTGGNNNGNDPNPNPDFNDPILTTPIFNMDKREVRLYNLLNPTQQTWWNNAQSLTKNAILDYFNQNSPDSIVNEEAIAFVEELIDLASLEPNQADVPNLVSLTILIENSGDQLFTEQFEASLVQYTDLFQVYPEHEYPLMALTLKTFANYKKLREINSEWSRAKCIFYASKDIIHLGLDVFGLVPLVGEPADIVNGLLYTIEGDDLNATLSYASAVPVLGWASSTTKFGLKVVNIANDVNTKVKLVWKVGANGLIEFGSSSQLRKVLNITSSSLQAHHIMPWAQRFNEVIQRAAKSGNAFHLNEALNGIAVATWRNQPNHNTYNNLVKSKLDNYLAEFPNATPQQCYNFVSNLVNDIRDWVVSHPNSHLNDLVLP